MSISFRWGVIALVALITSFTARYSMFDPLDPGKSLPYLIVALFALFACIMVSLVLNRRATPAEFDAKKGLQEGMKTALLALVLYSIYSYIYLSYLNPAVIENLVLARTTEITNSAMDPNQQTEALEAIKNQITPFKEVTSKLLILLSIAMSSTLFGTIIVRRFPI
jgi:cobalamin synthase